jgi:hypothetical protein
MKATQTLSCPKSQHIDKSNKRCSEFQIMGLDTQLRLVIQLKTGQKNDGIYSTMPLRPQQLRTNQDPPVTKKSNILPPYRDAAGLAGSREQSIKISTYTLLLRRALVRKIKSVFVQTSPLHLPSYTEEEHHALDGFQNQLPANKARFIPGHTGCRGNHSNKV